ncbi:hypothetical protein [Proteiniphilum sp. UBA5431]|jgi:hypothetical protein|uniref:hypothetical protein n=1 Tax=Proteiniphilum sp. UBA5431 TaxID=1947280 RepID=UPI00257E5077|nr:hypothetical protein [Proteiniphilum sp. UBA5431]
MIEISYELKNALIPLLNSKQSFELFDANKTCLHTTVLSFFRYYDLISARTFSTIPPVTMEYLWNRNNNHIIKLDGTCDCIFDNLEKLGLNLNDNNFSDYLTFVLENVQSEQGTLRLVQSIDDVEYSQNPTKEEIKFLERNIKPIEVELKDETCRVQCHILYGDTLYRAEINVSDDGTFEFVSEECLRAGLPVRQIFLE